MSQRTVHPRRSCGRIEGIGIPHRRSPSATHQVRVRHRAAYRMGTHRSFVQRASRPVEKCLAAIHSRAIPILGAGERTDVAVAVRGCASNAEATETACTRSVAHNAIGRAATSLEEVLEARCAGGRGCKRRVDRCACVRCQITREVIALQLHFVRWLTVFVGLTRVSSASGLALLAVERPHRRRAPAWRGGNAIGATLLACSTHYPRTTPPPLGARHGRVNLLPHDAISALHRAETVVVTGRIERVGWA